MPQPSTHVSRLPDKQNHSRAALDDLLRSTPLATIALVRDGHPTIFPTGFARLGDELVIHGSTGSPWLRALQAGAPAAVSVTMLDGIVLARSGFESSFRYRSAVLFGIFEPVEDTEQGAYLNALTDAFIPGRAAELRASTRKELSATLVLRLPIGSSNWSLKISDGWPDDSAEDIAAGAWAGVVPLSVVAGEPQRAPDCAAQIPIPASVTQMTRQRP